MQHSLWYEIGDNWMSCTSLSGHWSNMHKFRPFQKIPDGLSPWSKYARSVVTKCSHLGHM